MGDSVYVLYKTASDLQCPIILGVFYESGKALECLEEYLFDYYRELENATSYEEAEAYASKVTDALADNGEYRDETLCEDYFLILTTMEKIDLNPFIR